MTENNFNSLPNSADVSAYENADLSKLAGAEILVGYGTDPDEMLASGRYQKILTVPAQ